ncbi:MAG TPA: hypothetical protein VLI05_03295 [Candidatus Saccharimonadia bacterium]|nr:hypothetical protein [Candidatus Saccharimonadia bacterium]
MRERRTQLNQEELDDPDILASLAVRDIPTFYSLLKRHGWTNRDIADATEQTPSEVHAILHGRNVQSDVVLRRIGMGLATPLGYMGLAHSLIAPEALQYAHQQMKEDDVHRRGFLASTFLLAIGANAAAAAPRTAGRSGLNFSYVEPLGRKVDPVDVELLGEITSDFSGMTAKRGGFAMASAMLGQSQHVAALLRADAEPAVRADLIAKAARYYDTCAWGSLEAGDHDLTMRYVASCIDFARQSRQTGLTVSAYWTAGQAAHDASHAADGQTDPKRLNEALKYFQRGSLIGHQAGLAHAEALCLASYGETLALQGGDPQQAERYCRQAIETLAACSEPADSGLSFVSQNELLRFNAERRLQAVTRQSRAAETAVTEAQQALASANPDEVTFRKITELTIVDGLYRSGHPELAAERGLPLLRDLRYLKSAHLVKRAGRLHRTVQELGGKGDTQEAFRQELGQLISA